MAGCTTMMPRRFSSLNEGQWQAKVLLHDKQTDHSGIVNVTIKAVKDKHLRLDITSPMGTYLGSVTINGRQFNYLSVSDRIIYHMPANRRAMRAVLKVAMSPSVLYDVLFDNAPTGRNWVCHLDRYGYLHACMNNHEKLKILWLSRRADSRTIEIDDPQAQVQMDLYDFNAQIPGLQTAFILKAPSSFKVKNLGYRQTSRSETFGRN